MRHINFNNEVKAFETESICIIKIKYMDKIIWLYNINMH